jgi:hypothetical protein
MGQEYYSEDDHEEMVTQAIAEAVATLVAHAIPLARAEAIVRANIERGADSLTDLTHVEGYTS